MLSFAYFLAFVCAVSAAPAPGIVRNSERLARDLPPLPPRFFHSLPGHSSGIDEPTSVLGAKRSSVSATPVSYSGRIEVRNSENSVLGFLENSSGFGRINVVRDDLRVAIHTTSTETGPLDMVATHPEWTGSPYLGAGTSSPVLDLNVSSANSIGLMSVTQTPRNSPPVPSEGGVTGESRIWTIDPHTKEIKAQWINPDGTKPTTVIAYDIRENVVFLVGDLETYNQVFNWKPADAVKFTLIA